MIDGRAISTELDGETLVLIAMFEPRSAPISWSSVKQLAVQQLSACGQGLSGQFHGTFTSPMDSKHLAMLRDCTTPYAVFVRLRHGNLPAATPPKASVSSSRIRYRPDPMRDVTGPGGPHDRPGFLVKSFADAAVYVGDQQARRRDGRPQHDQRAVVMHDKTILDICIVHSPSQLANKRIGRGQIGKIVRNVRYRSCPVNCR